MGRGRVAGHAAKCGVGAGGDGYERDEWGAIGGEVNLFETGELGGSMYGHCPYLDVIMRCRFFNPSYIQSCAGGEYFGRMLGALCMYLFSSMRRAVIYEGNDLVKMGEVKNAITFQFPQAYNVDRYANDIGPSLHIFKSHILHCR